MKKLPLLMVMAVAATPVTAEGTRQLDAHEHGVGQLNIAFDGPQIAMEFQAPGADIVGFEYAAESAADRATVETALGMLAHPLDLFVLPEGAGCSIANFAVELEGGGDHDDHADEAGHTEFHAEYLLTCADPAAVSEITFAYFDAFPNALEVEVQIITDTGAASFEVERDAPLLDLSNM